MFDFLFKYPKLVSALFIIFIISCIVMLLIINYPKYFVPTPKAKPKQEPTKVGLINNSNEIDSLQNIYAATVSNLDKNLSNNYAINVDTATQTKLAEMYILKAEIAKLLKGKLEDEDVTTAKIKIQELQLKVAILQNKYFGQAIENKKLQAMLDKLLANKSNKANTNNTDEAIRKQSNTQLKLEKFTAANTEAVALHLFASKNNNAKEIETDEAEDAEKIGGTFYIQNANTKIANEAMIVVLEPNGKLAKNSIWETGTFETKEGKKTYSKKIFIDNSNDRPISFTLSPEEIYKGDYTMQVWYSGKMIGKTVHTLQ